MQHRRNWCHRLRLLDHGDAGDLRMLTRCTFCMSRPPKLSGEHIWDNWISRMHASRAGRTQFVITDYDANEQPLQSNIRTSIDRKLPVVCEPCNNGWMSEIVNKEARPSLKELILDPTASRSCRSRTVHIPQERRSRCDAQRLRAVLQHVRQTAVHVIDDLSFEYANMARVVRDERTPWTYVDELLQAGRTIPQGRRVLLFHLRCWVSDSATRMR
jgi:hypothetical protein